MISSRVKKRVDRILAGLVSAAMALTMVPEIWLPIHAQLVRDEIIDAETAVGGKTHIAQYQIKARKTILSLTYRERNPQ